jgi:predicted ferric reductase
MNRTFLPAARQITLLLAVGLLSLGCALTLRYRVIEQSSIGLACDAGLHSWLCAPRKAVIVLFGHSVFGTAALAAAVLNLIHPSVMLLGLGLAAGGLGIVLYNVGLSALAVALLILSLARPAPASG